MCSMHWIWARDREPDSYLKKRRGDALCFPGRVILTELADLIELDFFVELVQRCDVSAHTAFQISKIKSLIEDPASRNNVVSFKRNNLCFVLVCHSWKKKVKNSTDPGKMSVAII